MANLIKLLTLGCFAFSTNANSHSVVEGYALIGTITCPKIVSSNCTPVATLRGKNGRTTTVSTNSCLTTKCGTTVKQIEKGKLVVVDRSGRTRALLVEKFPTQSYRFEDYYSLQNATETDAEIESIVGDLSPLSWSYPTSEVTLPGN